MPDKYTKEEIIQNSEFCEQIIGTNLPFGPEPDGKYDTDKFASLGPCAIPFRGLDTKKIIEKSFDRPEELAIIDDETPNGRRVGTQMVVHKKHEAYCRRSIELTAEVYKKHGYIIGDPDHDKFLPFSLMEQISQEVSEQMKQEFPDEQNP